MPEQVAEKESLRDASCTVHNPQHRFSKTPIQPRRLSPPLPSDSPQPPPLSSLSLLLKHRLPRSPLFASVCFCSARSLESARVFSAGLPGLGDGGDSLESATRRGDATRFAALRYGRDRVSDGTPDIKSDAIMRRRGRGRARQSSPVPRPPRASCTSVRGGHSIPPLRSAPRRTFYIPEVKPAMKNSLNNK